MLVLLAALLKSTQKKTEEKWKGRQPPSGSWTNWLDFLTYTAAAAAVLLCVCLPAQYFRFDSRPSRSTYIPTCCKKVKRFWENPASALVFSRHLQLPSLRGHQRPNHAKSVVEAYVKSAAASVVSGDIRQKN